jgi:DNA-binding transcriptional MerR regulator
MARGRKRDYFYTSEVAREVGVHPNTVRLYEEWGLLPPVPRSAGGYRLYSRAHLDQMRLARTALDGPWPGRSIRRSVQDMVHHAASGDLGGALEMAYRHLALVQAERAQAEAAARLLERWAAGTPVDTTARPLTIGQAARLLGVTADALRTWERNGLLRVPRDPHSGYRLYGAAEVGRLRVIRMLSRAGYSQMAILRMMLQLDGSSGADLREALDTPLPDEDVHIAADRWLTSLAQQEERAASLITQLEAMIGRREG